MHHMTGNPCVLWYSGDAVVHKRGVCELVKEVVP